MNRRPFSALVVALLLALGLAVAPRPVLRVTEALRTDREPLNFLPTAASTPAQDDSAPVESAPVDAAPFVTIGVSLSSAPVGPVSVRWRNAGGWSSWHELSVDPAEGPDSATAEGVASRVATEPLWVGHATGYQVRMPHTDAASHRASAIVVRPDGHRVSVEAKSVEAGAESAGQPPIHPRSDWGARAPSNPISSASSLKLAVVHHSDTGNDYAPGDVPGILRSIQAYHMDTRGWSDIGYNFVVDKYGGIWEGRDGSLVQNSIGAHAEGFNTGSVGVMALGNYTTATPSAAQVDSIIETIAWKFAVNSVDPSTNVDFPSGGSPTIPAGTVVNLPRVVGHRDVGSTDCPGGNLYNAIKVFIRPALPARVAAKESPIGVVDAAAGAPSSIVVAGWAFDPLVTDPIEVHVYVDGVGTNLGPTAFDRPDLAIRYPGVGIRHGFAGTIAGVAPGNHQVCVFGINTGPGQNTLLACRTVTVLTGDPVGVVDGIDAEPDGQIVVGGWAFDPDTSAGDEINLYVDGNGYNLGPASGSRPDIGAAFPGYGSRRGFSWTGTGFAPGPHSVCVFAINVGPGANRLLECKTIVIRSGPPIGIVDSVVALPDNIVGVSGWAIDPDTAAAIQVHVYIDGQGTNLGPTAVNRPDIAAAFPGYGPTHGFLWLGGRAAPGPHSVCVFAINVGLGGNSLLRCQTVTVPGGSPVGNVDGVDPAGGRVTVSGWVIDPDVTASVHAHVYIDGIGYDTGLAAQSRPDVAAAMPGYGPAHGISWTSPALATGAHSVCVFGINVGVGSNTLMHCSTVTV